MRKKFAALISALALCVSTTGAALVPLDTPEPAPVSADSSSPGDMSSIPATSPSSSSSSPTPLAGTAADISASISAPETSDGRILATVTRQNRVLPGSALRSTSGSSYWESSNLREWLNTDSSYVDYTNQAPTAAAIGSANQYSNEQGFLHNFTAAEQSGVAVTSRYVNVHSTDAETSKAHHIGTQTDARNNSNKHHLLNYSFNNLEYNWNRYHSRVTHDKAFLLSPVEIYTYIQKRGWHTTKQPTEQLRAKENISTTNSRYWTSFAYANTGNEGVVSISNNGTDANGSATNPSGVAPAIHLLPDYTLPNGVHVSELSIGDKVSFGSYAGAPISWTVVNIADNGSPLLWSDYVITNKVYDARGDASYEYSESIDFPTPDVDLTNGLQYSSKYGDTVAPSIQMVNTADRVERKNDPWTIQVAATDNTGVKHIILPNGQWVSGHTASYLVSKNDTYVFTAVDEHNNYSYLSVPVGNINPPANVMIDSSADGWTNKDVTVDISASNDVAPWQVDTVNQTGRDSSGPVFPQYSSYAGKTFKVSGTVQMVRQDAPTGNLLVGMGFTMNVTRGIGGTNGWHPTNTWPLPASVALKDLEGGAPHAFSFEHTIQGDYFDRLSPRLHMSVGSDMNNKFHLRWTNVTYELVDDSDFAITKIELPSGQEVFSDTYKDTLSAEGTYTYKVHDNRGMVTQKSISVKVDKDNPYLTLTPSMTSTTHENMSINVRSSDSLSGVKQVRQPNGEWVTSTNFNYNISENGTYSFMVEDHAGNTVTRSVSVTNIDKSTSMSKPVVNPSFGTVTLSEGVQHKSVNVGDIVVKDWSDGANHWRVDVSASPMRNASGHLLPAGSLSISPLSSITKHSGTGGTPVKKTVGDMSIDASRTVSLVTSNNSRGEHTLSFPAGALKLTVDPITAQTGTYSTTVRWDLVRAP